MLPHSGLIQMMSPHSSLHRSYGIQIVDQALATVSSGSNTLVHIRKPPRANDIKTTNFSWCWKIPSTNPWGRDSFFVCKYGGRRGRGVYKNVFDHEVEGGLLSRVNLCTGVGFCSGWVGPHVCTRVCLYSGSDNFCIY